MAPQAYLNGRFVPPAELSIPVDDLGFVQGVTVAERLRTFGGKLFRLDQHIERLRRSLEIVGVTPPVSLEELGAAAKDLAARNHRLLASGDDLGLAMFVTPGRPGVSPAGAQAVADRDVAGPIAAIHTQPLPFHHWASRYANGEELCVSSIRQVPECCWPAELKCRSRMHYFLADLEARRRFPRSRAVLLDMDGNISEASTASVLIFKAKEGLIAPPADNVLPGVSLQMVIDLAENLGMPFARRSITPEEFRQADEILLCSTSMCVQPATKLDGNPVGSGQPGEAFYRLMTAWSEAVGMDIVGQANSFCERT